MRFLSRRLVLPNDLNYANQLFGGRALAWIDEEAAIFAICQLETNCLVTKHIGAINFESPALQGDVVEFGLTTKNVGRTSITITCLMRNKVTKKKPFVQLTILSLFKLIQRLKNRSLMGKPYRLYKLKSQNKLLSTRPFRNLLLK